MQHVKDTLGDLWPEEGIVRQDKYSAQLFCQHSHAKTWLSTRFTTLSEAWNQNGRALLTRYFVANLNFQNESRVIPEILLIKKNTNITAIQYSELCSATEVD